MIKRILTMSASIAGTVELPRREECVLWSRPGTTVPERFPTALDKQKAHLIFLWTAHGLGHEAARYADIIASDLKAIIDITPSVEYISKDGERHTSEDEATAKNVFIAAAERARAGRPQTASPSVPAVSRA
jgi:hypothetical protein